MATTKILDPKGLCQLLLDIAFDLLNNHLNGGGKLDYSEKEYGKLCDEIDYVQIGYFKDYQNADSDHAQSLIDEKYTLSVGQAIDILQHRIEFIRSEFNNDLLITEDTKEN